MGFTYTYRSNTSKYLNLLIFNDLEPQVKFILLIFPSFTSQLEQNQLPSLVFSKSFEKIGVPGLTVTKRAFVTFKTLNPNRSNALQSVILRARLNNRRTSFNIYSQFTCFARIIKTYLVEQLKMWLACTASDS